MSILQSWDHGPGICILLNMTVYIVRNIKNWTRPLVPRFSYLIDDQNWLKSIHFLIFFFSGPSLIPNSPLSPSKILKIRIIGNAWTAAWFHILFLNHIQKQKFNLPFVNWMKENRRKRIKTEPMVGAVIIWNHIDF